MGKIAIKYGLMMLVGFIGLFLLMHEIGQLRNYNLRLLNGFIHIGIITLAIREYRKTFPESYANYLSGVATGLYASTIGVVAFAAFMFFYLLGDTAFMNYIQDSMPIGQYLNPFTTTLFIVVEGIAVSLIGSYIVTRVIDMTYAGPEAWENSRR